MIGYHISRLSSTKECRLGSKSPTGNFSRRNQRWNSPFPPGFQDVCTEQTWGAHLEESQMNSLILDTVQSSVSSQKVSSLCHFYQLLRLKLYLRLEFGPLQLHHEEKIFKERCFATLFGMSDKTCTATNTFQMPSSMTSILYVRTEQQADCTARLMRHSATLCKLWDTYELL